MIKSGIVILDKPAGITSQTAVSKVKRIFGGVKAGHCGTLDPMATGVLPVVLGAATPFAEYLTSQDKEYLAGVKLGIETDTEDITGKVLKELDVNVSEQDILNVLPRFTGEIVQVPPMYSALKIGGKKLYEIARKGETVQREGRKVTIKEIELTSFDRKNSEFNIRVYCGKGTYIRTLAADIGKALGCGAAMASLRRTKAGSFTLQHAVTLAELEAGDASQAGSYVRPIEEYFNDIKTVKTDAFYARLLLNGQAVLQEKMHLHVAQGELAKLESEKFEGLLSGIIQDGDLYLKFVKRHIER